MRKTQYCIYLMTVAETLLYKEIIGAYAFPWNYARVWQKISMAIWPPGSVFTQFWVPKVPRVNFIVLLLCNN